jgi:hypothetical protein
MSLNEIGLDDGYEKILGFAANLLQVNPRNQDTKGDAERAYYGAATEVFIAHRLDDAIARAEHSLADAVGSLEQTVRQATKMFLDAADNMTAAANVQADRADRYARQLTIATWVLAGATIALVIATSGLFFKQG